MSKLLFWFIRSLMPYLISIGLGVGFYFMMPTTPTEWKRPHAVQTTNKEQPEASLNNAQNEPASLPNTAPSETDISTEQDPKNPDPPRKLQQDPAPPIQAERSNYPEIDKPQQDSTPSPKTGKATIERAMTPANPNASATSTAPKPHNEPATPVVQTPTRTSLHSKRTTAKNCGASPSTPGPKMHAHIACLWRARCLHEHQTMLTRTRLSEARCMQFTRSRSTCRKQFQALYDRYRPEWCSWNMPEDRSE
ncbi:MAG: hypothetical protein HQL50_02930 [Magnetococcales bacterium]|nr:hypothetical protein [Magnetococcales bacterium]